MSPAQQLADARYVSLTTYTRDGRPKSTPVWVTGLDDGTLGVITSSNSYKVKRLNNDPHCTLQPCDSKGNLTEGTEPVKGTAVASFEVYPTVRTKALGKYGWQYRIMETAGKAGKLIGKGPGADIGIVITLDS